MKAKLRNPICSRGFNQGYVIPHCPLQIENPHNKSADFFVVMPQSGR